MMRALDALRRSIEGDAGLRPVLEVAKTALNGDPGHDLGHALRVAHWTLRLGGEAVDSRSAIAAALLHDVVNTPKDSPERSRAGERAADVARELLPSAGFEAAEVERIAEAIRDHGFSRGASPSSPLAAALQDADRLEALGALGWMRAVSCGALMGASFFDTEDPWARHRALDDKRFTVDHIFVKLRKLPAMMNTAEGKREAERRAAFLEETLRQLADEIGASPPPP